MRVINHNFYSNFVFSGALSLQIGSLVSACYAIFKYNVSDLSQFYIERAQKIPNFRYLGLKGPEAIQKYARVMAFNSGALEVTSSLCFSYVFVISMISLMGAIWCMDEDDTNKTLLGIDFNHVKLKATLLGMSATVLTGVFCLRNHESIFGALVASSLSGACVAGLFGFYSGSS